MKRNKNMNSNMHRTNTLAEKNYTRLLSIQSTRLSITTQEAPRQNSCSCRQPAQTKSASRREAVSEATPPPRRTKGTEPPKPKSQRRGRAHARRAHEHARHTRTHAHAHATLTHRHRHTHTHAHTHTPTRQRPKRERERRKGG
jgi:hypothetical protein